MAPTTFPVTATFYKPDGVSFAGGNVVFTPLDERVISGGALIADSYVLATIINGAIAQTLVANTDGYSVQENVDGQMPITYEIPGNLSSIDLAAYRPS